MKPEKEYHVIVVSENEIMTWSEHYTAGNADQKAEYLRRRGFFKEGVSVEVRRPVAFCSESREYIYCPISAFDLHCDSPDSVLVCKYDDSEDG